MKISVSTALLTIFISLSLYTGLKAQETVSDFLLTAFEDQNLIEYDAQQQFLNARNYRIPIFDELEIRMGNNEMNYESAQYSLRLRPSNPWLIRRNNAFFNATRKEIGLRKKVEFKENMVERYELAVEYFYQTELNELVERQMNLVNTRARIFQNNLESDLFDARDFAEAKLDQVDEIQAVDEVMVNLSRTRQYITSLLGNPDFNWDEFDFISVDRIDSISSIIAESQLSSAELELITQQLEVARQEVRVEKADFDIGFIQGEYYPFTNRDSDIGFSVGLTIPIFRNNKNQIAERRLDQIQLENELVVEQIQDSIRKTVEYEHLQNVIHHHRFITEQIENTNLDELVSNLSKVEEYDPIALLELKEGISDLDEILLKSKRRVWNQYVDFLFAFDALIQQPLTNYLSNGLELVE